MENGSLDHPSPEDLQQESKKPLTQKRKTTDGTPTQPVRAKRNRYITIAWQVTNPSSFYRKGESYR
jgi:hypothetical protein